LRPPNRPDEWLWQRRSWAFASHPSDLAVSTRWSPPFLTELHERGGSPEIGKLNDTHDEIAAFSERAVMRAGEKTAVDVPA
jgi:hypothetical protein